MSSETPSAATPLPEASGIVLTGIGAAGGVACAPAFVIRTDHVEIPDRVLAEGEDDAEIARLHEALDVSREQIRHLREQLNARSSTGESGILDAHLMVLEDEALLAKFVRIIRERRRNAEAAVREVANGYIATFSGMDDPYMAERAADIRDLSRRVVRNLLGMGESLPSRIEHPCILVAEDLSPSEAISLPRDRVLGFAIERGSSTSHAALIARALDIPAVFGLHDITARVRTGEGLAIDGSRGLVVLRPTAEDLERFHRIAVARQGVQRELSRLQKEPAVTPDGHCIQILANVENVDECGAVLQHGAEGIGLFRSEFLWLTAGRAVSEEEQGLIYTQAAERMGGRPVIIRVFDLGGDKFLSGVGMRREANPFLGMRSIRFLLRHPDVFKAQLRAILRASAHGNVQVMYPMISDVAELRLANELLEACTLEVRSEGVACNADIPVGAMIEIPSAALTADLLAEHVDFFSIGTNDLTQYTLAVDRINDSVMHLYQPTHPAVLRLVRESVEAGHRHGLWVGVCGEMAADPVLAVLLLGLGVDKLSVAPVSAPAVKDVIRKTSMTEARELATLVLSARSASDAMAKCRAVVSRVAPELMALS